MFCFSIGFSIFFIQFKSYWLLDQLLVDMPMWMCLFIIYGDSFDWNSFLNNKIAVFHKKIYFFVQILMWNIIVFHRWRYLGDVGKAISCTIIPPSIIFSAWFQWTPFISNKSISRIKCSILSVNPILSYRRIKLFAKFICHSLSAWDILNKMCHRIKFKYLQMIQMTAAPFALTWKDKSNSSHKYNTYI